MDFGPALRFPFNPPSKGNQLKARRTLYAPTSGLHRSFNSLAFLDLTCFLEGRLGGKPPHGFSDHAAGRLRTRAADLGVEPQPGRRAQPGGRFPVFAGQAKSAKAEVEKELAQLRVQTRRGPNVGSQILLWFGLGGFSSSSP